MKHKALEAIKKFNDYYEAPMSTRNLKRSTGWTTYKCRKTIKILLEESLIEYKSVSVWNDYFEKSLPANGYMYTGKGRIELEGLNE